MQTEEQDEPGDGETGIETREMRGDNAELSQDSAQEGDAQPEVEPAIEPETPAVPNPEDEFLAPFKKDGKFDPETVKNTLGAANFGQMAFQRLRNNPKLERAWLEDARDAGQLDAGGLARLKELESSGKTGAAEAPKQMTDEELDAALAELRAQGRESAAMALYQKHRIDPQFQTLEQREKEAQATRKREEEAERRRQLDAWVKQDSAEAVKAYPTLMAIDPSTPLGARFLDKDVEREAQKIASGALKGSELVELALYRLKRTGAAAKAPTPVSSKKTAAPPAPGTGPKLRPGEVALTVREHRR